MTAKTPREIVLEDALRLVLGTWQRQSDALEDLEFKTSSVNELTDEFAQKLRGNIEWIQEVLE